MEGTVPEEGRDGSGATRAVGEQVLYADNLVSVTCTVLSGLALVRVAGEVDHSNSAELVRVLEQARGIGDRLVVDVGRVTFIDVTGTRALVAFIGKDGARVRNVPHQMGRLLRLMQLPSFDGPRR
ncbi:STAS domain-containing protein [Nonomuraea sp. SYSU D8015]|uniref:STAS domain-containing protein n=1 Tax=Nonomuraea sp. SYSU D8015 TaxID=2593644 RepID=UPI001660C392|nr:STAS domain-containing protein [Nonomuraea sp. SYSU D8015]